MEKSNPLVSVVIPVHNGEKYIKEAIDSCINQTYKNIEIIVVDDKSEDDTLKILKGYGKKITVIPVEKQNGLGNVINIGIRASKGKYIARMDADDVMYPTRIEKQVEYLESNPKCVAIGGQIDIIDENSKITGHREYAIEDRDIKKNRFLFQPFAHPAVTLRKSTVEDIGLYPENMWKVEDVKFFLILSTKGEFYNLGETVLKYRMTFKTESQSKMIDHFRKTNEIRNWAIKELNIKPSFREYVIWNIQKIGVYVLSLFPSFVFMKAFEVFRRVVK
ncbi:MAG: Glycosyl transferase family 2 [candidate division WS6 bacterium GW2011_GWE1_34_7]|uniref:Glycosyl transferase family 2 n=1 Tax=candidate division WS6 bacterium GW2011_GWE1_34_7 TaxID=1619093 RepID=A0A0G0B711_9BACT|nr:MAG: Glycosyl transferase family 2 [candidate division WS6 bacterium GW2011_GWE1_34_7]